MVASGIIRVDVEDRLITLFGALDNHFTLPDEAGPALDFDTTGMWLVTPPYRGAPPHPRLVVVGATSEANFENDAIPAGMSIDQWVSIGGLALIGNPNAQAAKREIQAEFNLLADAVASDDRLGMDDGPRDVALAALEGPYHDWIAAPNETSKSPTAYLNFAANCTADIERNQP